jgi:hypothetical protein
MVNLDDMTIDPRVLRAWAFQCERLSREQAIALVGKRKGYTRLAKQLAHYASNKATAMECRLRGDIQAAGIYEAICERIYTALPEDLRW